MPIALMYPLDEKPVDPRQIPQLHQSLAPLPLLLHQEVIPEESTQVTAQEARQAWSCSSPQAQAWLQQVVAQE